jgi:1,4-dihydroxy-2-naphthoyl-CoA hydrolase
MASPTAQQINEAMHGFDRLYGLEVLKCEPEIAQGRIEVREELKQPAGLLHGGVFASLAESLTSLATAVAVLPDGQAAMGLSNHTSFLRPITQGSVTATATRLHRGRTTWVWDVRFEDDLGRLCAVTRMTIAVRPLA